MFSLRDEAHLGVTPEKQAA